ncbi:MAG: PucR family transcriptional regulator [Galactobacter sp.]|uniref:PucR family transcriptional regulator n=1 Tax=Galactobacter sp. TaxID=2676125 RepID=UPI0025BD64CB|nr:PucR family transcriptional regulator [Galactobacter sp.]
MQITVASVLDLPAARKGTPELVSGQENLENPVRWVHVSEQLRLSDLLQGGELVLTTGLMLQDAETAAELIQDLDDANAAGLIVELLPGREPTMSALRTAARHTATTLPIVILHSKVRFVEFTEAAHRSILGDHLEALESNRRVHETFTDLALSDAEPATVLTAAADMLQAPVLLEDPLGRVVEVGFPGGRTPSAEETAQVLRHSSAADHPDSPDEDNRISVVVRVRNTAWGRLVSVLPDHAQAQHVLERAAQAVALHLMAERDERDLAGIAQSSFLTELNQWSGSAEDAQTRAASLGLNNAGRLVPLAVRTSTLPEDPLAATREERRLRDDLTRAVDESGATALVGHLGADGLSVLLAPGRGTRRGVTLDRVASAVVSADPGNRWVAVGPTSATVVEAAAGLVEAAHVAEAAQRLAQRQVRDESGAPAVGPSTNADERAWYRAADVRLPGLMAMLAGDERVVRFARSELGPLLEDDREEDLAFLRTLVAAGGSKQETARRAYLSRPAVYHRISRLEEELGVSLSEPASLTSLAVALSAAER